jgi:hypothetical protein
MKLTTKCLDERRFSRSLGSLKWTSKQPLDRHFPSENQPSLALREVAQARQSCLLGCARYSTDEKPLPASHAIVHARE